MTGIPTRSIIMEGRSFLIPDSRASVAKETVTIALNGEVILPDFTKAIDCFKRLVEALTAETAGGTPVEWILDSLEVGSALATVKGRASNSRCIEQVIGGFERVAKAVAANRPIPFSDRATRPVDELRALIDGRITSIRLETADVDAEISQPSTSGETTNLFEIRNGAVRGRIQSISNRGGLRFTLFDELDDHAVSCYLAGAGEDILREAWGKTAEVEGIVRRNKKNGRPSTVRKVASVIVLHEGDPDEWRQAIGCAPAIPGSISPEEAIRRGRDG